jgi:hypothetical protein
MTPEQLWFTATGTEDGLPLIFRGRQNIPVDVVEAAYPIRVRIFWPYEPDNDRGMPKSQTNDAQIEFEDALAPLDTADSGFQMLVVTGNGRKEWHWYVANLQSWMDALNEALNGSPEYPIEIENSFEPDWSLYHGFISNMKGI